MIYEIAQIVGVVFQLISAFGVGVAIWASLRNHGAAQAIKFEINGRMNQLLALTAENARQKGILVGRAEAFQARSIPEQSQINLDNP